MDERTAPKSQQPEPSGHQGSGSVKSDPNGTKHGSIVLANGLTTSDSNSSVERLAQSFERSARRWEMVAYPAMAVFTLLALFGFYKIYTVSENMRGLAEQLQPQMDVHMTRLTTAMESLTANISLMSRNIESMQMRVSEMAQDTHQMATQMKRLDTMDQQLAEMNRSVQVMTLHTDAMRWNMTTMNNSIQRPMGFVNRFMPW